MSLVNKIELEKQLTSNDCSIACIAMITGRSADTITENLGHLGIKAPLTNLQTQLALAYYGLLPVMKSVDERIEPDHVYIVTVPSLNIIGGLHSIVMDTREENEVELFDPCEGVEGKLYYDASNFKTFAAPIKVIDPAIHGAS